MPVTSCPSINKKANVTVQVIVTMIIIVATIIIISESGLVGVRGRNSLFNYLTWVEVPVRFRAAMVGVNR